MKPQNTNKIPILHPAFGRDYNNGVVVSNAFNSNAPFIHRGMVTDRERLIAEGYEYVKIFYRSNSKKLLLTL